MSHLQLDTTSSYDEDLKRNSSYEVVKKIGEGAQGIILLIKKDNELYAAKVFKYYTGFRGKSFDLNIGDSNPLMEINFGLRIKHPYIIEGVDFIFGQRYIFYIMKKADIDLGSFFKIYNFPTTDKIQIIFRLACGFNYIHQCGFVHGDIKSINILLDRENVFISDFGLTSSIEDKDMFRPFQTLNHRPPENILNKENDMPLLIYKEQFKSAHYTNFKLGESWSFGILCLDIIYNIPNVVLSTSIYKSKFVSLYHKRYNFPYNLFIDTLSKLNDTEKYPCVKNETTCTLVKNMLGDINPDLEELLELVCEKLLVVDLSKRSTIQDFLQDDYFVSKGLNDVTHHASRVPQYTYYKVDNMYTPKPEFLYTIKNLELLVDWIIKIYNKLKLGLIILMNTIDYIIQKYHIFVKIPKEFHLFGMCVMWIMTRLYNYEVFIDISYIMNATKYYFSQTDIFDMLISILKHEKGIFNYESLYFQLPSENLLIKGVKIMRDVNVYINDYKTPSNLSHELIKNESSEEIKNRIPRSYNYIYV